MSETLPNPSWGLGYVPPPSEWNNWWGSKFGIVPTGVIAAGTNQGTAAALQSHMVVVTAGGAGTGVITTLGYHEIWNDSGFAVLIYPQSGVAFRGLSANLPYSLPYYSGVGAPLRILILNSSQGYVG